MSFPREGCLAESSLYVLLVGGPHDGVHCDDGICPLGGEIRMVHPLDCIASLSPLPLAVQMDHTYDIYQRVTSQVARFVRTEYPY